MQPDYVPFIDRVIDKYEGGYGWNRKDPGGPTKYGITCYDLAEHRGQTMTSMDVWAPIVRDMPRSEAEDIYRKKYAQRLRFDELPPGIDCCMLDYGINSGIARPIRVACALLGLPASIVLSDDLLHAISKRGSADFINSMCQERLHYMHQIRDGSAWEEFGKGWGARVNDLSQYCTALASHAPPAAPPDLSKVPAPKATHDDPEIVAKTVKKGTVITGAQGTAIYASGLPWYFIAAGVAVIVVCGIAYVVYKQDKAARLNATVTLPGGSHA